MTKHSLMMRKTLSKALRKVRYYNIVGIDENDIDVIFCKVFLNDKVLNAS